VAGERRSVGRSRRAFFPARGNVPCPGRSLDEVSDVRDAQRSSPRTGSCVGHRAGYESRGLVGFGVDDVLTAGACRGTRTAPAASPGRASVLRLHGRAQFMIVVAILRTAIVLPFLPETLKASGFAAAIRAALLGLLLLVPGLIVVRETQRAAVRGTAVALSPSQFPDLYRSAQDFADELGLQRRPDIFLTNGNGSLNAFAAQATGHDYVVLSNELFGSLYNNNREGLRFILGHEMGHVRLHHVSLWYQIAVAYSERIPLLGPALSRLREYSCDRHGAYLAPGALRAWCCSPPAAIRRPT
jgi:Zn-dependent protease with chaperone function